MKELYLTSKKPVNGLFINDSPVLQGVWLHHNSWGMNIPRGSVEGLHDWLGQWLKENPEKVEGWVNVYPSGVGNNIQDTKDEANRLGHNPQGEECRIACIPISYHKGEGLTTEEPGE